MPKIKISSGGTAVSANEASTTYVLAKGATLETTSTAITSMGTVEGTRFMLDGRLTSTDADGLSWGHELWGGMPTSIDIGKSGKVSAEHGAGIRLNGDGHHVDNAGSITANVGISIYGPDSAVINSGTIVGPGIGISAWGDMAMTNSGSISSENVAIFLHEQPLDTGSVIRNSGKIDGSAAIFGTALSEKVINSGDIKGEIILGGGEDTFVFKKGGSTDHAVQGGEGGDRYIVHDKAALIAEDAMGGIDFVKSTVSYTLSAYIEQINLAGKADINATGNDEANHVQGNAGKNVLRGEGGMDYLLGLGGNDKLFGGEGEDFFAFLKGSGRDTIMDFEAGIDEIQFGGLKGAKDFDNMLAKHTEQHGDDVWITYGKDVVVLRDADADHLQAADFTFG